MLALQLRQPDVRLAHNRQIPAYMPASVRYGQIDPTTDLTRLLAQMRLLQVAAEELVLQLVPSADRRAVRRALRGNAHSGPAALAQRAWRVVRTLLSAAKAQACAHAPMPRSIPGGIKTSPNAPRPPTSTRTL